MSLNIAHQFSESAFRKYEPCIATIMKNYPNVSIFDPSALGVSHETFRARIRDAMKGWITYRYTSRLSLPEFLIIHPYLKVSSKRNLVYIGTSSAIKSEIGLENHAAIGETLQAFKLRATLRSLEQFLGICELAHMRALKGPIEVEFPLGQQVEWRHIADTTFDVDISPAADGKTFIIT